MPSPRAGAARTGTNKRRRIVGATATPELPAGGGA